MRKQFPKIGLNSLCKLFGKTRHAYYDALWRRKDESLQDEIVLQLVKEIRQKQPKIGTRKLQFMLKDKLSEHKIQIGRDGLFDLLAEHKLLVKKRKRRAITTNSHHWMKKYDNLIENIPIIHAEQLWVSDITYLRVGVDFGYLSLITDAYSRQVMGYYLAENLSSNGPVQALLMALKNRQFRDRILIHHSDRGVQYCSSNYVEILTENKIAISMTQHGDPYENALAERINGILKDEFNLQQNFNSLEHARQIVSDAINTYNLSRPHASCDYLTPIEAHQREGVLQKRWKKYLFKKKILEE